MWTTALSAFLTVFVAELGDKTQLATLGLAAERPQRIAVFIGSAAALVCTSLIAVLSGGWVAQHVPPLLLKRAAGALFLVLGAWTLWGARG